MKIAVFFLHFIIILLILTLASCPAPFNAEQLAILQDTQSPVITITSPGKYSEYATVINLTCTIDNNEAEKAGLTEDFTVVYEIPGTTIKGSLTKQADGSFAVAIDVSTLDGSHIVKVTATDLNGNNATSTINIVKPAGGGDISDFKITPSNGKVTITWNDVPLAESYTLTEFSFGKTKNDVTSPYVWEGLENGAMYSFQLTANIPASIGSDAYSATINELPLSSRTFAPHISATGYKSISLEWWDDTNISSQYRVLRSASQNGPWTVRRSLTGNGFTDTEVKFNTEYWYKVYLTDYPTIASSPISVIPARFRPLDEAVPTKISTGGHPQASYVSGSYAYIGDIDKGLVIFNISDPDNPVLMGNVLTNGNADGIFVEGNYAYVADTTNGLVIIDITNKSNPIIRGSYDTTGSGSAHNVFISDSYAYVAWGTEGLVVVNISDPDNPTQAGLYDTTGDAEGVYISGSYAYIADGTKGLVILDVSNLSNIIIEQNSPYTGYSTSTVDAHDIYVSANYAYISDGIKGIVSVYINNPDNPSFPHSNLGTMTTVTRFDIGGNFAYVADRDNGIHVFNLNSTGSILQEVGTVTYTTPQVYDVAMAGSHVFIADQTNGLVTTDAAIPDSCTLLPASVPGTYHSGGITVAGDYVYMVNKDIGELSVVSIATPSSPSKISTVDAHDVALKVKVAGNYAFVANDNYGMSVYNISNPASPSEAAHILVSGASTRIKDIDLDGSYAYAADGTNGMVVFDISDPEDPSILTVVTPPSGYLPTGIAVSGNYVFMVSKNSGSGNLTIYDVTDPSNPSFIKTIGDGLTSGDPTSIAVDSSYAYITLSASNSKLVIYDVSDPPTMQTSATGSYTSSSNTTENVTVHGKYAYLAAKNTRPFEIVDVSDPQSPHLITYISGLPDSYGAAVAGEYAFMAVDDSSTGLKVIQLWEDM